MKKLKLIYGGTNQQTLDFVKRNQHKLLIAGVARNNCYRIINSHEQLKGYRRNRVEILAVGTWKARDGSAPLVTEARSRGIRILTKDGYYGGTGK